MPQKNSFYVTTPIYYVNDAPHIGHAYTTTLADVLVRYHRMLGHSTFFLTGTDEHGQKVQQAAAKRGVSPQEHVDSFNVRFKDLWSRMDIDYDHFIRTTDADHKAFVSECLQMLWDKGEIYAKQYEGWYSVGEERFFGEDELVDGKDPVSGRPVEWIQEKNYFFRMSSYQQRLIDHIEQNPTWILPDFRRNEVLGFLRQPLGDLCISRPKTRLNWGIPLPFDPDFVTYVWFDALINYVSAVRNRTYEDGSPIWPATVHLIGKDILTTHAVYWPTMLMGLGIELPQHLLAHGWWMNGGAKMSKSTGNIVDPTPYMDQFGVDTFRYFLMRDMVVGQDSTFSDDAFIRRSNSDLANDLGNGLNRVHRLVMSHFEGILPAPAAELGDSERALMEQAQQTLDLVETRIRDIKLSQFAEDVLQLVRAVNRYLEQRAPWKLAKEPEQKALLATVLYTGCESMRIALQLLAPILPTKCAEGLAMLGCTSGGPETLRWGVLRGGEVLGAGPGGQGLFPRIETEKNAVPQAAKAPKPPQVPPLTPDQIPAALDLRVAKIVSVQDHPNAESLWHLSVDAGEGEPRSVCAGLRKHYSAEQLLGRHVVLFANLKAAPLRGVLSQGMLLAGDGAEGAAVLVEVPPNAPLGERVQLQGVAPLEGGRELRLKDFEKIALSVQGGRVCCDTRVLSIGDQAITCPVADGSGVH